MKNTPKKPAYTLISITTNKAYYLLSKQLKNMFITAFTYATVMQLLNLYFSNNISIGPNVSYTSEDILQICLQLLAFLIPQCFFTGLLILLVYSNKSKKNTKQNFSKMIHYVLRLLPSMILCKILSSMLFLLFLIPIALMSINPTLSTIFTLIIIWFVFMIYPLLILYEPIIIFEQQLGAISLKESFLKLKNKYFEAFMILVIIILLNIMPNLLLHGIASNITDSTIFGIDKVLEIFINTLIHCCTVAILVAFYDTITNKHTIINKNK